MALNSLPLELIIEIASIDAGLWFKLTLIDARFKEYTYTRPGINAFVAIAKSVITYNGFTSIKIFGKLHSINDEPAIITKYDYRMWYYADNLHRVDDKPAVIIPRSFNAWSDVIINTEHVPTFFFDNSREWFRHGVIHRDNCKPARMHATGILEWWHKGAKYMTSQIVVKK